MARWTAAGGSALDAALMTQRVKRALGELVEEGIVSNPMRGLYLLSGGDMSGRVDANGLSQLAPTDVEEDEAAAEELGAGAQVGLGSQIVYAFHLPTFEKLARAEGRDRWPTKIGYTTGPVASRMASHRTALPEEPVLSLLIHTDDAARLEKVIHGILSLRGQRSEASGGSEWFDTNADELVALHARIFAT